jgi:hypothetical protein
MGHQRGLLKKNRALPTCFSLAHNFAKHAAAPRPPTADPNPSSDEVSLDFRQAVQEPFTLVLRDLQGRVLASRVYPLGALPGLVERISLAHLPEGVYTLAFSAKSSRYVEKIVIKR